MSEERKRKLQREQELYKFSRDHTPKKYRRSRGLRFRDDGRFYPTPKQWCCSCRKAWSGGHRCCPECKNNMCSLSLRAHVPRLKASPYRWKEFYKKFPETMCKNT